MHETAYGEFDTQRVYLVASSSKILSVGVLMRLANQGKLDLDAPVSKYLSAWGEEKSDVTVAQLVSNSSGLVGLIDNPLYAPYLCQYISGGTLAECAKTIYTANDTADRKPPDTEFHYGGGQWQLAGGIAEVVSGKTWADLVKETYTEPCGATGLAYTNQFTQAFTGGGGNVAGALGYPVFFQADVANLPVTENPSIEGGAYTTLGDYGKVLPDAPARRKVRRRPGAIGGVRGPHAGRPHRVVRGLHAGSDRRGLRDGMVGRPRASGRRRRSREPTAPSPCSTYRAATPYSWPSKPTPASEATCA